MLKFFNELLYLSIYIYAPIFGLAISKKFTDWVAKSLLIFILSQTFIICLLITFNGVHRTPNIIINLLLIVISIFYYRYNNPRPLTYYKNWIKPLCALLLIIGFSRIYYLQIHHNYNGEIQTHTGNQVKVKNYEQPDPIISDEWYSFAFSHWIIEHKKFPVYNPLERLYPKFINLQLPFHLYNGAIFLHTKVNRPSGYSAVKSYMNSFFAIMILTFILSKGVPLFIGLLSLFGLFLLPHSANLFTIWTYIPINLGLLLLLISITLSGTSALIAAAATLLFYPPLIIILVPIFLIKYWPLKKSFIYWSAGAFLLLLVFLILILQQFGFNLPNTFQYLFDRMFFASYTHNFRAYFHPHLIIPLTTIIGFIFSLKKLWEDQKEILVALCIPAFFWIVYFFQNKRWILEHERAVFICSVFIIIASAFGFERILKFLQNKSPKFIPLFYCLLIFVTAYKLSDFTNNPAWKKFIALDPKTLNVLTPAAPIPETLANEYRDFTKYFRKKNILSIPSLGTSIPIRFRATSVLNLPGTITLNSFDLKKFMAGDCLYKQMQIEEFKIQLIILPWELNCPKLKRVAGLQDGIKIFETELYSL